MDRIPYCSIRFLIVLLLVVCGVIRPLPLSAADDLCDPELFKPPTSPLSYQLRDQGDRCEGQYVQKPSSPIFTLISLTESFENYNLKSGKALTVAWKPPNTQPVHLRAYGPRLFYRMDTLRTPEKTSYIWPTDVLRSLNVQRADLGVVGWINTSVGKASQDVYLPLKIWQTTVVPTSTYQVVLWTRQELSEVIVSLAPVTANGTPGNFILDEKPLKYGYYPAERGIDVKLPKLPQPGIYYLEFGAQLKSGGSVAIQSWFYHAE
jgi:hypothetical protein